MNNYSNVLNNLFKSKFRSSFPLKENDFNYIHNKGINTIRKHAEDFIKTRLAPAIIPNDGKQTPMQGHPIFIAEHATATCCRACLYKWHRIPKNKVLTKTEIDYIVNVIMQWINKELSTYNKRNMNV